MKLIKTEDSLHTIYSEKYNETYHSRHGVFQEADHVFIQGCDIPRLMHSGQEVTILEVGFGTGFNFFLTAQLAAAAKAKLTYFSLENDLLSLEDFKRLNHSAFFPKNTIWQTFIDWREQPDTPKHGSNRIETGNIQLILVYADALNAQLPQEKFDAVFHDAFSPGANPELWTCSFFEKIKSSMKNGAKLSTYSAKGAARRAMLEAGFSVKKEKGPMGKREMLTAIKQAY